MMETPDSPPDAREKVAPNNNVELESMLLQVEGELVALGEALRQHDGLAIEDHAQQLHHALERAVDGFSLAARTGGLPAPLRTRLAQAGRRVAAQRDSLARASMALDRAIDSLLPREPAVGYGAARWLGGNA